MDANSPNGQPAAAAIPARRRRTTRISLALLAGCAILALWGNNRRPADPTETVALRGTAEHTTLPRQTIRLGTFNIHGLKGPDGRRDIGRTAKTLRDLDIVALQEVRSGWEYWQEDQALRLGERLGMASLFASSTWRWWTDTFGTGLLTRVAPTGILRIPLPGRDPNRFRNAVLIRFPHQGTSVNVLAVHLDNHADHDSQLRTVIQLFLALQPPAVLMGDLNTEAGDPQFRALLADPSVTGHVGEQWDDRQPLCGVDWIVLRGLRCVGRECRDLGASDHPALCAEVEILPAHRPIKSLARDTADQITR